MSLTIQISELQPSELKAAAGLLARAMATNPVHLAIFRRANAKTIATQQKMFEMVLNNPTHKIYAARKNGQIVGIMSYTPSTECQLRPMQFLRLLPLTFMVLGPSLVRILKWRMNWKQHDPSYAHIHFGPLAVDPVHQGKGIGKALLQHFCDYANYSGKPAYLETDKNENVHLYQKFGFQVIAEDEVLGVPNWFMLKSTAI